MPAAEQLITDNLNVWSSAIQTKSSTGRGKSNNLELYGVKKLRELILELAVRGLLVPQDSNDEPASELLKKIEAEKAQLVKDGKIKKPKKIAPIEEGDEPFELPESWQWARLDALAPMSLLDGDWVEKKDQDPDGNIRLIQLADVGVNRFKNVSEKYINEDAFKRLNCTELAVGDILIARLPSPIGRACIFPELDQKSVTAVDVAIFRPCGLVLDQWLVHSINSITFRAQVESYGKGATRFRISTGNLKSILVPLCPEQEQARIVAKVDELMALCDQLEQQQETSITAHQTLVQTLLDALTTASERDGFTAAWARIADHFDTLFTTEWSIDRLKRTILQLAVMGKLVPQDPNDEPASELLKKIAAKKARLIKTGTIKKQKVLPPIEDDEKPFELPKGWEWARLPEIGELARGKSKHRPRNDPKLYVNGKTPMVQTGDVAKADPIVTTYTARYNEEGVAQSRVWPKGTMCITIAANIADTGILGFTACFPDSVVGFIPLDANIEAQYFEYFIRTAKEHLEDFAPSTAQKNINLEILGKLLVPLPPANELNRIVAKVDELMALCDTLKTRVNTAQTTQLQLADAMAEQALV